MSKKCKKCSEEHIFDQNPFLEELLEWSDSLEGERSMEVAYTLSDLIEDVQLDAKQRKFVWPDAQQVNCSPLRAFSSMVLTSAATRLRSFC